MSRDKQYQRLLNSKRWKELRAAYLKTHPLCEQCEAEGFVTAAVDCHHIIPVESARYYGEMIRLAFSPDNIRALCIPCHIRVHKEARSHSKDGHRQREADRLERWKMKHNNK